jgi:hypothetical protein
MQRRVVKLMLTDVSEVCAASIISVIIAVVIEAVRTSEMSINFNVTTQRYISEDSNFILAAVRT